VNKHRFGSFSDARICNREDYKPYLSVQMSKTRLQSSKRLEEEKVRQSDVLLETKSSVNNLSIPTSSDHDQDLNITYFGDNSSAINLTRNGVGFAKLIATEDDPNSRNNSSF